MGHDEAVFDRARLAFVGIADDVLHAIGLFSNQIPFHAGGKTGAAHAAKLGGFEPREDVIPGARLYELANNAVFFCLAVRISFASDADLLGVWFSNIVAADGAASDLFGTGGGDIREDLVVDGNCRGMIAAAEAGHVANLNFSSARTGEAPLEVGAQLACAVEMAAHVGTNANLGFGRRHKMKMRVKTRHAVNLVQRSLRAL